MDNDDKKEGQEFSEILRNNPTNVVVRTGMAQHHSLSVKFETFPESPYLYNNDVTSGLPHCFMFLFTSHVFSVWLCPSVV